LKDLAADELRRPWGDAEARKGEEDADLSGFDESDILAAIHGNE
jgi:hypothetical protein